MIVDGQLLNYSVTQKACEVYVMKTYHKVIPFVGRDQGCGVLPIGHYSAVALLSIRYIKR